MSTDRIPNRPSERERLDPFVAIFDSIRPRDQRDLMERPFFSLAKTKRIAPILYRSGDVEIEVHAVPEYGMATIWDADVLIWAASQIVEAEDHGFQTSRFFRFTPYQLLLSIGRGTGLRQYTLLKRSLQRLQSTAVATTLRHGEHWRRQQFSWINEWEERVDGQGSSAGVEFVLPEWFYRGVVDRSLVLTIDPAYFRLTGGVERWLYRVARKHAGRQPNGWTFELRHLHEKSGSQSRFSDFLVDLRRIILRQSLPGYELHLAEDAQRRLLKIRPRTVNYDPVDNAVDALGTSGAKALGISGADPSVLRAQGRQLVLWPTTLNRTPNLESNEDSNFYQRRRFSRKPRDRRGEPR